MKRPSDFTLAILGVVVFTGALVSGFFTSITIGIIPLFLFSLKSFLLGLCLGVVAIESSSEKSKQPIGLFFIIGFAFIIVIFSVLIITGLLTVTSIFVFLFGFLVVYSKAAKKLYGNARVLVEDFSCLIILISLIIAAVFVLGFNDEVAAYIENLLP